MLEIKRIVAQPFKVGGILGGVFGFVSDFLQPVAEVGYLIATACFVGILITLVIKTIAPVDQLLHKKYKSVWYAPLFFTLIIFSAILTTANYISIHYGKNQQGVIATNSDFISELQRKLIGIEESLSEIQKSQKEANIKLNSISHEQKNISHTIHLNIEQLKQSILSGNLAAVEQFHIQGGDLNLLKEAPPGYVGWNEAIIVSLAKTKNKNSVAIIDYILNNTSIDPNSLFPVNNFGNRLSDAYISLLNQDSKKRYKITEKINKACMEEFKLLLGKKIKSSEEFDFKSCTEEKYYSAIMKESLNIDDTDKLKTAMNTLIDEARQAGNMEMENYLKSKHVEPQKSGLLILESGKKIPIPPNGNIL